MIRIEDKKLLEAASAGFDAFLSEIISAYMDGYEDVCPEQMGALNWYQNTLLAYHILAREVSEGGFLQLIQNGYGGYIFNNPFAKSVRLWGFHDLSKLIYKAKKIYDANREDLESDCSDEEFMAKYERYSKFDDIDDEFIESEELWTNEMACYVDENIDKFIDEIVKEEE